MICGTAAHMAAHAIICACLKLLQYNPPFEAILPLCASRRTGFLSSERFFKKIEKKVLTIGMRGGIITELSREAGANRSLKIEQQTRQDVQRKSSCQIL